MEIILVWSNYAKKIASTMDGKSLSNFALCYKQVENKQTA
jgi:hypothetical protein